MSAVLDLPSCCGAVRGKLRQDADLSATTWFRAGGRAALLFRPADTEDLCLVLAALPEATRLTVLGAGSNVIIRDGGIPGLTVRLGGAFADMTVDATGIEAGAACLDAHVAAQAAEAGLTGLEFLSGIPGSLGGAVAMNAGAYGSDIAAVLDWADVATPHGVLRLDARQLALSYRHACLPVRGVVVRARLRATRGDPAAIAARMRAIATSRAQTQPVRSRTGGSTFRNPAAHESGLRAWELIDAAGCRGMTLGDAQVSELHCNFLINRGEASATELESLGEAVRGRVRAASGVDLRWEIRRIGLWPAGLPRVAEHGP